METITFDTLKLSEDFTHAGFEEKKARVLAETFGKLSNEHVTKTFLKNELEKLELRLTIKMAVVVAAVLGFFRVMEAFFSSV